MANALETIFAKPVDAFATFVVKTTARFVETRVGKFFLWLMVIGPFTLVPTVWEAWTASNIDALRTATWPTMIIVDLAFLINVCRNGDWKIQLTVLLWIIMAAIIWSAALIR